MTQQKRPGADESARAGEIVLVGTTPHSTPHLELQRHRLTPCRLIGWRVNRWLGVERVEVRYHG